MINTKSDSVLSRNILLFFSIFFYEQFFHSQLDMKFILFINVKMPTIDGMVTFICRKIIQIRELESKKNLNFPSFYFL